MGGWKYCITLAPSHYLNQYWLIISKIYLVVAFIWGQFRKRYLSHHSLKSAYLKLNWNFSGANELTHWGRVTHICVSKLTIIGSDNGLSPDQRQAIIWTNAGILLIGPLGTNFSEILVKILTFSFKKMRLKVSSVKRRPFCLGLNGLIGVYRGYHWPSEFYASKSMAQGKTLVTPLLMHWSYQNIALSHQYDIHRSQWVTFIEFLQYFCLFLSNKITYDLLNILWKSRHLAFRTRTIVL